MRAQEMSNKIKILNEECELNFQTYEPIQRVANASKRMPLSHNLIGNSGLSRESEVLQKLELDLKIFMSEDKF